MLYVVSLTSLRLGAVRGAMGGAVVRREWCGGAVRVVRWCGVGGAAVRCAWVVQWCSSAARVVQ